VARTGFPEAIEATWPTATVQTCTVHLIRSSMRFISYGDRKAAAAALRPVCTAPTAESARMELEAFAASLNPLVRSRWPSALSL
jgi:putative transposase